MKSWPIKGLLGVSALVLVTAGFSQVGETAQPVLPPGFGDPEDQPPPPPPPPPIPTPVESPDENAAAPTTGRSGVIQESPSEIADALPEEALRPVNYFRLPEGAVRSLDQIGVLDPGTWGMAPDGFGNANGVYLTALMDRLDAPLPSRWASILLRRTLLSRLNSPALVHPADWVAARTELLLRMGEADAARILVQQVDQENFTPRFVSAGAQAALATSDPAGLCPMADIVNSRRPVWTVTNAMCAALEGEAARAAAMADEARRRGEIRGIDFQLAEKVIGAGAETRRAVTIDWEGTSQLNPWRVGLAAATGVEIPDALVQRAAPNLQAWMARAPMLPLEQRLGAASVAASLGVFSSQSLVSIYSHLLDQTDPAEAAGTVGARLRTAWLGREPSARMEAIRSLWQEAEAPHERHSRLILTAGAAARIPVSSDYVADAGDLIRSMLSAGMDRHAARWMSLVEEEGDPRAWSMLAVSAPGVDSVDPNRVEAFVRADDSVGGLRAQMLVAALAGLGRLDAGQAASQAETAGFTLARDDRWSRAIDRAARERAPATVALLTAVGMQGESWRQVSPAYLFRMVRALRATGREFEARMIAAEALARL